MSAQRQIGWSNVAGAILSLPVWHRFVLLLFPLLFLTPSTSLGMSLAVDKGAGSERVGLSLSGAAPNASAVRTGLREITIHFPAGLPPEDRVVPSNLSNSPLLAGIEVSADRIVLKLKTEAFGFVQTKGSSGREGTFAIQVFADAIGARWKPSGHGARTAPAAPAAEADGVPSAPAISASAAPAASGGLPETSAETHAGTHPGTPTATPKAAKGLKAEPVAAPAPAAQSGDAKAGRNAKAPVNTLKGSAVDGDVDNVQDPTVAPDSKVAKVAKGAKIAKVAGNAKEKAGAKGADKGRNAAPIAETPLAAATAPLPPPQPLPENTAQDGKPVFPLPPLSAKDTRESEQDTAPTGQVGTTPPEPSRPVAAQAPPAPYVVRAQVNRGGPESGTVASPRVPAGAPAVQAPPRAGAQAPVQTGGEAVPAAGQAPDNSPPAAQVPDNAPSQASAPPVQRLNDTPLPTVDPFEASGRSNHEVRRTVRHGGPVPPSPPSLKEQPQPTAGQAEPGPARPEAVAAPAPQVAPTQATQAPGQATPQTIGQAVAQAPEHSPEKSSDPAAGKAPDKPLDKPVDKPEAGHGTEGHGAEGHGEPKKKSEGPTVQEALDSAKNALLNGEYESAVKVLLSIRNYPDVSPEMREEALYLLAEALFSYRHDDLKNYFADVTGAFKEAMNANTKSPRLPTALLGLGYVNLNVGNIPEAKAYFNLLKKRFPKDEGIPSIDYYWGQHYYSVGKYAEAAKEFQHLIQTWPDHRMAQQASLGLAKALSEQGNDKEALQIIDYIGKRWPRFYLDYPAFLRLSGDVAFKLKLWDRAKTSYWSYYNLQPAAEDSHIVLARLGDAYAQTGAKDGAKGAWSRAAAEYPDKEGGLISRMRLAEEGIFDTPSLDQMRSVFERPATSPVEAYSRIVAEHPESQLAPLAQLKLAMYHLWSRQFDDCLKDVAEFEKKFPRDPLLKRTTDVGVMAFAQAVIDAAKEGNYGRVTDYWNRYGFLQDNRDLLAPEVRLAAAVSLWRAGRQDGLVLVQPMLAPKDRLLEPALDLTLAVHTDNRNWAELARLGEQAQAWSLSEDRRRQLDYAVALARENLGDRDKAQPLWSKLAGDAKLGPDQRAYALFYTARAALDGNDPKKTVSLALEAQGMFKAFKTPDTPKLKDCAALLMEASQRLNKPADALKWAEEYDRLVEADDPEWAASRYRIAQLRLQLGDRKGWRESLDAIVKKAPDSLYGKTAVSALKSESLEQTVQQYSGK